MIKNIILFIIIALFIYSINYFITYKRNISFTNNGTKISIDIPTYFSSNLIKVTSDRETPQNYINIKYGIFAYPIFFFCNKDNNTIYILYWFDTSIHVFSIKERNSSEIMPIVNMNKSLKKIVLSRNNFNIFSLSKSELSNLINHIELMSEKEYKNISIPKIDFGLYKMYVPKNRVLNILKSGIYEYDINASVIQSRLSIW